MSLRHCTAEGADDDSGIAEEAVPRARLRPVLDGALDPVSDLLRMPHLHDSALLYHIRRRYWEDRVYTAIGPIIIALNPYNFSIRHYDESQMTRYDAGAADQEGGPYLGTWSVAHSAYWAMRTGGRPQAILVSGESGAGKTEAAKIATRYIARMSTEGAPGEMRAAAEAVTARVQASSPILEAFGNAKTVRNDNSSRFGKFMRVQFDPDGVLIGCQITPYLLEKSRVVTHGDCERSYHAYYQLLAGADEEDRARYHLDDPQLQWIYKGWASTPEQRESDAAIYREVRDAMTTIGLSPEEQRGVYDLIAGILHFQSVIFEGDREAAVQEGSQPGLALVAQLWGVGQEQLCKELVTTTNVLRGEAIEKKLRADQAVAVRDGLSKALYEKLFLWLIDRMNATLDASDRCAEGQWLGLLDIFGFENFTENSLEQLCINLANEQLQNHYNAHVFQRDMAEYRAEGLDTSSLDPPDNAATLEMLSGKMGIFDILNDSCKSGQGTDEQFLGEVEDKYGKHPSMAKKKVRDKRFGVNHYAGPVWYTVTGFREKNMDTLKDSLKLLIRDSSVPLIAQLLPDPDDSPPGSPTSPGRPASPKKKVTSVAAFFKKSLLELVEIINSTEPHWVRCVKPHRSKKARMFSGNEVMDQLRFAGVLETVKIRQTGFPVRLPFTTFWGRFRVLLGLPSPPVSGPREGCEKLAAHLGLQTDQMQLGSSKAFLRDPAYKRFEDARNKELASVAVFVQNAARARLSVSVVYRRRMQRHLCRLQAALRARCSAVAVRERERALFLSAAVHLDATAQGWQGVRLLGALAELARDQARERITLCVRERRGRCAAEAAEAADLGELGAAERQSARAAAAATESRERGVVAEEEAAARDAAAAAAAAGRGEAAERQRQREEAEAQQRAAAAAEAAAAALQAREQQAAAAEQERAAAAARQGSAAPAEAAGVGDDDELPAAPASGSFATREAAVANASLWSQLQDREEEQRGRSASQAPPAGEKAAAVVSRGWGRLKGWVQSKAEQLQEQRAAQAAAEGPEEPPRCDGESSMCAPAVEPSPDSPMTRRIQGRMQHKIITNRQGQARLPQPRCPKGGGEDGPRLEVFTLERNGPEETFGLNVDGTVITGVSGPAAAAGLAPGMRITLCNGKEVDSKFDILEACASEQTVELTVYRVS
eukprot:TRINITY_DN4755_c0_g2_i1.p1 TRINITY_DN4755_c0_g2~~TRINITY_DN4755_c0_g2_i1.p1  ORF type:complete len:1225 (+),score=419.47 TRINITY_DN4755_c0_g2_i1:170-3676(+)